MKINHLKYVAFPEYSLIFNHTLSKEKLIKLLSGISCEKAIAILSRFASLHIRFLYKGIIIKHNKTEPTYTKTSLFLCEKRRFFMGRTEKGGKVF